MKFLNLNIKSRPCASPNYTELTSNLELLYTSVEEEIRRKTKNPNGIII